MILNVFDSKSFNKETKTIEVTNFKHFAVETVMSS